ncbi:ATP-grasp fold amidoligase family protein [Hyphomicrobium sp. 99]|uniref:ATP-grasp fold amidoligase family protein n=1 Tax=Hyphomicrobium sp. 99 TaxID=1163419 RepID=UPI000695AF65|nr:ATP-grasp fold amidoligase family protein [Hyphomicrobium sp. 99]
MAGAVLDFFKITIPYWVLRIGGYLLPSSRLKERNDAFAKFIKRHRRYPTKNWIFSDVLYRIKSGPELRDPVRTFTTDKELGKIFISGVVGPSYNVPTIGVIRSQSELEAFQFPDRCFIKATHASGLNIFRERGEPIDYDVLAGWLKHSYYKKKREANYRDLAPKIIVEPPIFEGQDFYELNLFCYGEVKVIIRQYGNWRAKSSRRRRLYTAKWEDCNCSMGYPLAEVDKKPAKLDEIVAAANAIAAYFSLVRIDVYTDDNDFFIGEITHCHAGGGQSFIPAEAEIDVSKHIFGASKVNQMA